ncbi:MAG TPA: exo-alpha-sialidase [Nitrospirales bacterium]|nr:exo-alpha-sialidase [Nitrospirales bacterium]
MGQSTGQQNIRISDYPIGEVTAMTLSAGQRGLAAQKLDSGEHLVVAVWSDERAGRSNIFATQSLDNGTTFSPSVRVNDIPDKAHLYGTTVVIDAQGHLYAVWLDDRDGDQDIYFSRSVSQGITDAFSASVKVNDDETREPAVDEFGDPEYIEPAAFQTHPMIVLGPKGAIYVAWQDYRRSQADIYFSKSMDGGRTFDRNVKVTDEFGSAGQLYPSMAVSPDGTISLAWHDHRKGNADIFFARSTDGGESFSRNLKVSDDETDTHQFSPSLAVDQQGHIYIAWHDLRNNSQPDIYFGKSVDGGQSFGPNVQVSDDPSGAFQFHPSIAVMPSGMIGVVWEDKRHENFDIFFSTSHDGGKTFSKNVRLDDDSGSADQLFPSLAVGASEKFLVMWTDERHDDVELSRCPPVSCSDIYFHAISTEQ